MKYLNVFVFSLLFCFSAYAQETWVVDNPHSNVRFEVGWEDFSMRTGEFKTFEGSILSNSLEDLSEAVFAFKVDASSVDVIADRLADRIKNENFLDVEKFPAITYFADEVKQSSDSTYVSKGKITIHGVEKEQEVLIWVKGRKQTNKGEIFGLEVSLVVNRTDFGLDWGGPRLGETIKIVGYLLYKQKAEPKSD